MSLILNLETATKVCSVTLAKDGEVLFTKEQHTANFSHAENLNLFIVEVMKASGYQMSELDAVAVSQGPGSYTGLRIGVSTAKGLCYGLDIPLIAVSSLKALAALAKVESGLICPMFDARRMEVYTAIYDQNLKEIRPVEAKIIEADAFESELNENRVVFLGPGAEKCQEMIKHPQAIFDTETRVSASGMARLAHDKYKNGALEDLAYFEPFYLKDFIAGKPKKLL